MNIDALVDDILIKRHEPDPNEDPELYAYIKNIFEKYHVKYIADKIYQTAINPNFKYWIDISSNDSDEYKIIWIPKYEKFSGIYEIKKNTINKKLTYITNTWHHPQFKDIKGKTTPLEWMAAHLSTPKFVWRDRFDSKFTDLFYTHTDKTADAKMFKITVIAALDASMKLFTDDEYVKIAI